MVTLDKSSSGNVYSGLFGCTDGGEIKNIGITGNSYTIASTSADAYVGGLVGRNEGSINNSYAAGNVYSYSYSYSAYAGGLVGKNEGSSSISNSYAAGNVYSYSSSDYTASAGGLVGINYGSISNSYATGNVSVYSSYAYAGGLVALGSGSINNSYATGNVSSSSFAYDAYAGGLVGYNIGSSSISNSYAAGNVSASSSSSGAYAGGLVGRNEGSINNSYAAGNVYSSSASYAYAGGLVGYSSSSIGNSYAAGNVYYSSSAAASSSAGGLVGRNEGSSSISNSYATGNVSSSSSSAGGLVGINYSSISNSYRNSEAIVEGTTINEEGTPLTVREMTGTGENRADEKMAGFKNATDGSGNKIWAFTEDKVQEISSGTYTQTFYYPRLSSINYKSGSEPKNIVTTYHIKTVINVDIIGELYEGEVLEAKITPKDSSVNIQNLGLKYQWIVGDSIVEGATQNTYTLKSGDIEENIQVKITSDKYFGEIKPSTQRDKSPFNLHDQDTKVWLLADYGVFPYGSKLSVKDMNEGENYNTVLSILDKNQKDIMERIKFYDISILDRDGNPTQPNGKVTIRLPIPDDFDKDDLEALRVTDGDDVEYENEKVVDIDGVHYLEFETDHFSYYALMDKNIQEIGAGDPDDMDNTGNTDLEEPDNIGNMVQTSDNSPIILMVVSLILIASGLVIIKERKKLKLLINF